MRQHWRWGVILSVVAALIAVPALLAARTVHAPAVEPVALVARIRASGNVPWSGYGESRGGVALPDVKQLGDLTSLLGGTNRYRVWWHDRTRHRVDALRLTGEKDTTEDATGSWRWDSDEEVSLRVFGAPPVRLLEAGDLVAPTLGRRLAGTTDVTLTARPGRRVAGHDVPGVRLTPKHPSTTTIAYVDLWADPATGLVLRVDVQAVSQRVPVMRSLLLSLDLSQPSLKDASFTPPSEVTRVAQDDLTGRVNQLSPYDLPDQLGGMRRTALIGGAQGVATYGSGFGQVLLLPLPRGQARDLSRSLRDVGGSFRTAMLNGVLVQADQRRYLLAGTVSEAVLHALEDDLLRNPPPERS
jgi:hypothetical protein